MHFVSSYKIYTIVRSIRPTESKKMFFVLKYHTDIVLVLKSNKTSNLKQKKFTMFEVLT